MVCRTEIETPKVALYAKGITAVRQPVRSHQESDPNVKGEQLPMCCMSG